MGIDIESSRTERRKEGRRTVGVLRAVIRTMVMMLELVIQNGSLMARAVVVVVVVLCTE
jgi:hypothetical protein